MKRLSKIIFHGEINGIINEIDSTIYTYNGVDTIPIKMNYYFQYYSFFSYNDTATSFFTYNNLNQITKDSTIYSSRALPNGSYVIRKEISNYSYATNINYRQFSSTILFQSQAGVELPEIQTDTVIIDANRNAISVKSLFVTGNILPNISSRRRITTLSYDNKPSAFLLQNISHIFPYFPVGENILYPSSGSNNNRLTGQDTFIDSNGSTTVSDDFTGKYTYLPSGYPKLIFVPNVNVPTDYIKYVFVYTTL